MITGQVLLVETDRANINAQIDIWISVSIGLECAIIGAVDNAGAGVGTGVGGRGAGSSIYTVIGGVDEGIGGTLGHALVLDHIERVVDEVVEGTGGVADAGGVEGEGSEGAVLDAVAVGAQVERVVGRRGGTVWVKARVHKTQRR
jgi:hypothetical protein